MMKPEPSELVLRGDCISPLLSPPFGEPPRRFLKKSSKNSSNGDPGGNCGIASLPPPPPLASTLCDVEILTTESITFSAMSAMPSGPRALAGTDTSRLAALNEIAIPIRRRQRLKAGLAPVMSARLQRVEFGSTVRPNGSEAQASAPDIPAKNRPRAAHDCVDATASCAGWARSLRGAKRTRNQDGQHLRCAIAHLESRDTPGRNRTSEVWSFGPSRNDGECLPPHEPDQHQTRDRRDDADDPQDIVRRSQGALHRPPHPGRAGCEHQALEHKEDAHTDDEVGERYGPHRIPTPAIKRLLLLCRRSRPQCAIAHWASP